MEIRNSIDKLKTIRQTLNTIADSYSSFAPKESVSVQLYTAGEDLTAYKVKVVNTNTGNEEYYDIPANGLVEFEIKYDTTYEVNFPTIGAYITPAARTFTAQKPIRKIEVSYVVAGVFGIDADGKYYTIEQIEALEDKSIIKYGGYTDESLENFQREDGTLGCGIMWDLYSEIANNIQFALKEINFDSDKVPNYTSTTYDGQSYTLNIIQKGNITGVETLVADYCAEKQVMVGNNILRGFLIASQLELLIYNNISFDALYNACGLTAPQISVGSWWTSCQLYNTFMAIFRNGKVANVTKQSKTPNIFVCYPLPK